MTWACPVCKSRKLSVTVCVEANLHQSQDNFETEIDGGDHVWDGCSSMTCADCNYCGASREFEE